jgi:hypothetical protein
MTASVHVPCKTKPKNKKTTNKQTKQNKHHHHKPPPTTQQTASPPPPNINYPLLQNNGHTSMTDRHRRMDMDKTKTISPNTDRFLKKKNVFPNTEMLTHHNSALLSPRVPPVPQWWNTFPVSSPPAVSEVFLSVGKTANTGQTKHGTNN